MPDPKDLAQPETSSIRKERLLLVAAIAVLTVIVAYFFVRSHFGANDVEARNLELEKQLANISEKLREIKTAEIYRQDQQQAMKSRLQKAADGAKSVATAIETLGQQIDLWRKTTADALSTDKGKPVAANVALLQQFSALQNQKRPDPNLAAQLRLRLDTLIAPINTALHANNTSYAPSEDLTSQLAAIESEAAQALDTYRDHNQQLKAILSQGPSTAPAGTPTLQDAIAAQDTAWANERAERIAAEVAKVRRENDEKAAITQAEEERKLAAAKLEQKRIANEIETTRVQDETSRLREEAGRRKKLADDEKAARRAKEDAENKRLATARDYEQDLPNIKRVLSPFFKQTFTQPSGYSYVRITTKGPVSLQALQNLGALDRTEKGIKMLYSANFADTERHGWVSEHDTETIVTAQNFLIKYGDLMVKDGLLAP